MLVLILISSCLSGFAVAQENEQVLTEFKPKIRGAVMMAYSHVPKATEGGKEVIVLPAWGFDLDYFFHSRWSVAIQGDIKLQSFEVEDEQTILQRSYPVAMAGVIHYHAKRHWSFYVGPGYEFESHENLFLWKAGTEYSFEITEKFEIALNVFYENKDEVYDSWGFGVAFNKKLWEKK